MLSILLATTAMCNAALIDLPATAPTSETVRIEAAYDAAADEHMRKARQALDAGDLDLARREFVIAAALERDAGRVPADATFGLAHVLYAQSCDREAAIVLNKLAEEASRAGDANTEARALADAVWLNATGKQFAQARADASRLRKLLRSDALTEDTRRHIIARTS
jgi:tetratricopeptide (TPR) repeat protein